VSATPVNVVVIFYSCSGETEKLALAAAVGAVQARGSIRMRRLTDSGEDIPEYRDTLARMRREYVPPAAADILWADAVLVAMNGTIAGVARTASDATDYGRRMTLETRAVKERNR
jgi:hypothetical protein